MTTASPPPGGRPPTADRRRSRSSTAVGAALTALGLLTGAAGGTVTVTFGPRIPVELPRVFAVSVGGLIGSALVAAAGIALLAVGMQRGPVRPEWQRRPGPGRGPDAPPSPRNASAGRDGALGGRGGARARRAGR